VLRSITQRHNKAGLIIALVLFVVCVVRIKTPNEQVRVAFQVLVEWGAFFLLACMLYRINRWIGVFVLIMLFYHIYPGYRKESIMAMWAVAVGGVWFLACVQFLNSKSIEWVLNVLCVIALLNVLFLMLQVISGNKAFPGIGLMCNPNEISCLLGLCAPAFFRKGWIFCIPILIVGIVLTKSLSGIIIFASAVLVYAWYFKASFPIWFWVLAATVIVGFIYLDYQTGNLGQSVAARYQAVKAAMIAWYHSPYWMGWGLGTWKILFSKVPGTTTSWMTAHNEYAQLLVEAPLSLIAIGGYCVSVVRRFMHTGYSRATLMPVAAVAAAVVGCTFHFVMHIGTTAVVVIVWLAILEVRLNAKV